MLGTNENHDPPGRANAKAEDHLVARGTGRGRCHCCNRQPPGQRQQWGKLKQLGISRRQSERLFQWNVCPMHLFFPPPFNSISLSIHHLVVSAIAVNVSSRSMKWTAVHVLRINSPEDPPVHLCGLQLSCMMQQWWQALSLMGPANNSRET